VSDNNAKLFYGRIKRLRSVFFSLSVRIAACFKNPFTFVPCGASVAVAQKKSGYKERNGSFALNDGKILFRVTTRQRVAERTNYRAWHLENARN